MRVLITGSTGYIGRRLLLNLLETKPEYTIRLFVSDSRQIPSEIAEKVEIVEGNTFNIIALKKALHGVDIAYYLIHSMRAPKDKFVERDKVSAQNFIDESVNAGVKRIIYLGGLGAKSSASRHLTSRHETGEILSSRPDKVQTIWFRAAVIIGAGGASYEIVKHIVEKLPFMIAPTWVKTATQPIAVDDVIEYLTAALEINASEKTVIDIGANRINFLEMLKQAAEVRGLKRFIIPLPILSPKLSAYWLILITPVHHNVASALVDGLKVESVKENNHAEKYFPHIKPVSYYEAIKRASEEEEQEIISRWCDGSGPWFNSLKKAGAVENATHTVSYSKKIDKFDRKKIWQAVFTIGGTKGWPAMSPLWKIRGFFDKLTGGAGINRGRRSPENLRIGDSLDFWKVIDIAEEERLLLFSQMRLPGKGWLEFTLSDSLSISAHFIPSGLYGRIYWYLLYPFHEIIFRLMLRRIVKSGP